MFIDQVKVSIYRRSEESLSLSPLETDTSFITITSRHGDRSVSQTNHHTTPSFSQSFLSSPPPLTDRLTD